MKRWLVVLLIFLVGIAVGIAGTVLVPRAAGRYLPVGKGVVVEGEVVRKLKEQDRLLLTVRTELGTLLATFRKRVTEIDLLVSEGDLLALAIRRYEPFVDDPTIDRVRKLGEATPGTPPAPLPPPQPPAKEQGNR
ncbi:MAG TPA: hypothetical protein VJO34_06215 [Methylomirabilota bacterium]|nr:hypothetical protein [Methylomirabilota bacterium]